MTYEQEFASNSEDHPLGPHASVKLHGLNLKSSQMAPSMQAQEGHPPVLTVGAAVGTTLGAGVGLFVFIIPLPSFTLRMFFSATVVAERAMSPMKAIEMIFMMSPKKEGKRKRNCVETE